MLEIIAIRKGITPYKKIARQNSLALTPENDIFFEKSEFYSKLKQKLVSDEKYKNLFYLCKILKMRSLSDMNNLYNAKDVILPCEIIDSLFG